MFLRDLSAVQRSLKPFIRSHACPRPRGNTRQSRSLCVAGRSTGAGEREEVISEFEEHKVSGSHLVEKRRTSPMRP